MTDYNAVAKRLLADAKLGTDGGGIFRLAKLLKERDEALTSKVMRLEDALREIAAGCMFGVPPTLVAQAALKETT